MKAVGFPRVLVVTSNNFNSVSGGGITLTNLFRGWPSERIANVHEDSIVEDRSVCFNFYRLSDREIQWCWPFSLFQPSGHVSEGLPATSNGAVSAESLSRILMGDGIPRRVSLSNSLRQWIEDFKPEVIYSFLGSMAQIRLTRSLVNHTGAKLAIHVMDDWPEVIYRRGVLGPVFRPIVLREFGELLRISSLRLGICEDMCTEYFKRYGYRFLPFQNAVDTAEWKSAGEKQGTGKSPFIVCYSGSIVPQGQRESLKDICRAVDQLSKEGSSIQMRIYSPPSQAEYLRMENFSTIQFNPPPEPDQIVSVLSGANLLVLPFNFDPRSAHYLRLSMPTKVPAYMASGTPILVYGPANIAPVSYAQTLGWGFVLTKAGVSSAVTSIRELMSDRPLRERLGKRAQALAFERHDVGVVRAQFQSALMSATK